MSESDILVNFEIWVKRQPTNRVPRGSHVYYIHVIWYTNHIFYNINNPIWRLIDECIIGYLVNYSGSQIPNGISELNAINVIM